MRTEAFPLLLGWDAWAAVPPAFLFFAGAIVAAWLHGERRHRARQVVLVLLPFVGALNLLNLDTGVSWVWHVLDLDLVPLRVDRLSLLFGLLFHIGALVAILFALKVRSTAQHVAALVYAGSAMGAVFAGDLVTLFFYWEGMAISSVFLVWGGGMPDSGRAGLRYLIWHVFSGLLLLAGAVLHYSDTGSLAFEFLGTESVAGWLILGAFGIKAGFPLLHNWITDAYPQSTPSGTVFLSIFTTKVAVYALARGYAGTELLILVGTVMTVFPIFYAVIEDNLRRVLGYSMINQIGFMVVGVGIGTDLALNGAVSHAFNEVLFKGLLFMSMGAVLFRVGHTEASKLGALYKSMPLTTVFCVVGAASISAFPLFSGFVSKSMIMAAMIEEGHEYLWLALLFASAGVLHHAGIKIPYFAFFAHASGLRTEEAPRNMLVAMGVAAVGCVLIGSFPAALYALLPWDVHFVPYNYTHIVLQVQLLVFASLAFAWTTLTHVAPPEIPGTNLDAEWLYRRLGYRVATRALDATAVATRGIGDALRDTLWPLTLRLLGPKGVLTRPLATGNAALWAGIVLAAYLMLYLLSGR